MGGLTWPAIGVLFTLFSWSIGATVFVLMRIRDAEKAAKAGDDVLHSRINDVREQYVRRDDLAQHMTRIENSLDSLSKRFDEFLKVFMHGMHGPPPR